MASLRAWWKGERSPEDPLLCFLLSLHYAAYLTFLLLWLHRNAAHFKALEWRVFIEGSLLVPAGGLVLVLLVLAGSGARVVARTATLTGLLAMNAVVLTAAAVAIRIVAPEWHRVPAEPIPLLTSRIHAAVALLPLSANALALVALRRLPALRPLARSQKPIVSVIPLTLTLALALLSVSTPPPLHLMAAALIASALLTLARYRLRIERGAALTRLGDAVVVATIAWLVFDPHLHFDVFSIDDELERRTIDVRFANGASPGFIPRSGQSLYGGGSAPDRRRRPEQERNDRSQERAASCN